ncbi:hypothetical protein ACFVZH_26125 [Streptomyces sp. NPDC059534]|uniref:hypothetical protein n=1 Tax=Streptomyces sp. NPDC059534 TaxID=3346859 RepID=UPI0036849DBD
MSSAARYGRARALEALEALDRTAEATAHYEALWGDAEPGSPERAVALVRCHTTSGELGIAGAWGERALADFTDHGHP